VEYTSAAPAEIVRHLAARGFTTAVLAGGAQTYRAFLDAGMVTELWLTIEPLAFGGGISLFGDAPLDVRFALTHVRHLSANTLHVRYRVLATA
jgi:riboflavin biosynthesis pyrimidine reductase